MTSYLPAFFGELRGMAAQGDFRCLVVPHHVKTAGPLWDKTKIVGKGALATAAGVGGGMLAMEGLKRVGVKVPPKYMPYAIGAMGAAAAAAYGTYKALEAKELQDVDQAEAHRRSGAPIQ